MSGGSKRKAGSSKPPPSAPKPPSKKGKAPAQQPQQQASPSASKKKQKRAAAKSAAPTAPRPAPPRRPSSRAAHPAPDPVPSMDGDRRRGNGQDDGHEEVRERERGRGGEVTRRSGWVLRCVSLVPGPPHARTRRSACPPPNLRGWVRLFQTHPWAWRAGGERACHGRPETRPPSLGRAPLPMPLSTPSSYLCLPPHAGWPVRPVRQVREIARRCVRARVRTCAACRGTDPPPHLALSPPSLLSSPAPSTASSASWAPAWAAAPAPPPLTSATSSPA